MPNPWKRFKSWLIAETDQRESEYAEMDAYVRGSTMPPPDDLHVPTEYVHKRLLDENPVPVPRKNRKEDTS